MWMISFCVGDKYVLQNVVASIQRDYHIESADMNDVLCVANEFAGKLKTKSLSFRLNKKGP
jgi:hypothetical protein